MKKIRLDVYTRGENGEAHGLYRGVISFEAGLAYDLLWERPEGVVAADVLTMKQCAALDVRPSAILSFDGH